MQGLPTAHLTQELGIGLVFVQHKVPRIVILNEVALE